MFTDKPIRLEFDDRRELYRLIDRLEKRDRIAFLNWACKQVSKPDMETRVTSQSGETEEVFWDAMNLSFTWGLPIAVMGERLIRMCRKFGR